MENCRMRRLESTWRTMWSCKSSGRICMCEPTDNGHESTCHTYNVNEEIPEKKHPGPTFISFNDMHLVFWDTHGLALTVKKKPVHVPLHLGDTCGLFWQKNLKLHKNPSSASSAWGLLCLRVVLDRSFTLKKNIFRYQVLEVHEVFFLVQDRKPLKSHQIVEALEGFFPLSVCWPFWNHVPQCADRSCCVWKWKFKTKRGPHNSMGRKCLGVENCFRIRWELWMVFS